MFNCSHFQKYLSLKFIVFLTFFFGCSLNQSNAQSGFNLTIDGLVSGAPLITVASKIVTCADGGYFMTGASNTPVFYVIKTDSLGTIQWSKNYTVGPYDYNYPDIIGTNDSGFYFMINKVDGMFATYNSPIFLKVNKYGDIQNSRGFPASTFGTSGITISYSDINKVTNEVMMMGFSYSYNGSNGPHNYNYTAMKLDTSLNISFMTSLDNGVSDSLTSVTPKMKQVYLNGQLSGYLVTGLRNNYKSIVYFLDTAGTIIWSKNYSNVYFRDWVQVDSNFYLISHPPGNYPIKSTIHKMDFFGNLLFNKKFQSTSYLAISNIDISVDSTFMFGGIIRNPQNRIMSLAMISNLDVDSIQATHGTDTVYNQWNEEMSIESKANAFLFIKNRVNYLPPFKAAYEKYVFGNSSCNYNNLSVTTTADTVTQAPSSFISIPYTPNLINYTVIATNVDFFCSNPCPITGISENNLEFTSPTLILHPNPVQNELQIKLSGKSVPKSEISIFNLSGEIIMKDNFEDANISLPVSNLASGIYFVKVISDGIQLNGKFVKL